MSNQAKNVISRFGGAGVLARAIGKPRSTVYKWTYSKEKGGTGGVIPHWNYDAIFAAAERLGVVFGDEDWVL